MNNPALYTKSNSAARRFADIFSKEFEDEIGRMSGRCLDIGSGPGDVAVDFILPKLNPQATIVCSDISNNMVQFGKEKYKDNHRLSFIQLDIETPDLPEDLIEKFDHATSFYCIHWCRDMRRAFENIFALLRPGGTTFIIFIASYSGLNAYKELAAMPSYQPYMKDADRYIPVFQHSKEPDTILKALVEDVGFEVHHCSVREHSHTHKNRDAFAEFIVSVNPFIDRIPADLKKQYEEDLVTEAVKQSVISKNNEINERECGIHGIYKTSIMYLRKPLFERHY